jgi:hypothetical protein
MSDQRPTFDVLHFSQPSEEYLFSERNTQLLAILPELNDAMDNLFDVNNPKARRMADIAVIQACLLLLIMFELQVEPYGWNDSKASVQSCLDRFGSYLQTVNLT